MKKLLSVFLSALMLFALGCSKQDNDCKISIEDFASATPENAKLFLAYNIDKNFIKKYRKENNTKGFILEITKNEALQKILKDIYFDKISELTQGIVTQDTLNKSLIELTNTYEDFFLGCNLDALSTRDNLKGNLLISSSLTTNETKKILDKATEKNIVKKFEKDSYLIYKNNNLVIAIKGKFLALSNTEDMAIKLIANIKKPLENSFAKTQNFAKLKAINPDADILLFANVNKETNSYIANTFVSSQQLSDKESATSIKLDLGENGIKKSAEVFKSITQRTLKKGNILKNSMKNSLFALGISSPKVSNETLKLLNEFTGENNPSAQMVMQMLSAIDLKSLYLSCGDLDAEKLLKIQETMQPPEMFIKIECENSDAFFKNPMMAQMLNSPFISQMQVGENTIYTTVANIKFAQISKSGAFISTITDLAKTTNLAKEVGEDLSENENASYLVNKLPEGGQIEAFVDIKKLNDFSMQMQEIIAKGTKDATNEQKDAIKLSNAFNGIIKKSGLATSVKFDGASIIINILATSEYDFEKAIKQLKELK